MSASTLFNRKFKMSYVKRIYHEKIAHKCSPGIDRINRDSFEKRLDEYVKNISIKALDGSYTFIPYKEKLISKGFDKLPRQISIPSIRDKITLNILNEFLSKVFEENVNKKIIQSMVNELKNSLLSNQYDYYIKIDIKNFFPSISHDKLLKMIRKKIRKKEVLALIEKAMTTPTIPYPTKDHVLSNKGVPQGIAIASMLANIYLSKLDRKYLETSTEHRYFRYVDDILILCKTTNFQTIKIDVIKQLKDLNLEINIPKYKDANLSEGFSYLGYYYTQVGDSLGFSVREETIRKFEDSIIKIFSEYKFNNKTGTDRFIWKLNKKITGCIFEEKKYGWLFFYSQIDDKKLLYHFDWFIQKLCKQIGVDLNVQNMIKRFVRTHHEIIYNLKNTNYIPNFDKYDVTKQKSVLQNVFNIRNVNNFTEDDVRLIFKKNVFKFIKELEKDVQNIS